MKKFLLVMAVVVLAAFQIFKYTDRNAFKEHSRKRVQMMFENLKSGNSSDEQDAMGYWRVGHPESATEANYNAFARFRSAAGIGKVDQFSIVSFELVGDDQLTRHVDFVCQLNGKEIKLRARAGQPLETF